MRSVLVGYDRRYDRLVDWVTETEGDFDDHLLGELPVDRAADRPDLRGRRPLAPLMRGIGVDVVDVERFRRSLARTPSMRERLFTAVELEYVARKVDPVPSLAARFAAREAVMKALGLGLGAFGFHEVWVEVEESGAPRLVVTGRARELAADRGVVRLAPVDQPRRPDGHRHGGRRVTVAVTVHGDPDRHAGRDGRPSTPPRRSRSRCSSSGPARPWPGWPARCSAARTAAGST